MPASITLSGEEIRKLRKYVGEHSLKEVPVKSEHELFRVKDKGVELILYRSGKLVYEDNKETIRVLDEIMETEDYDFLLGTDEAGKGEWYGPLVVECVALKPSEVSALRKLGVRDSKKLTKNKILELGEKIKELGLTTKPLILMPETYNQIYERFKAEGKTLNDLMAWAHARAIKDLLSALEYDRAKVVIDRFDAKRTEFRLGGLNQDKLDIIQKTGGESEIPVAAASVLAKYIFEREVDSLNRRFGIDLRKMEPKEIPREVLPKVAKLHFKNV
ncbi:MAG: hypothetical protein JW778_05610 [Candidatus Altiarchaeota archaeon]|nr:hypothetical protein [Candidatus Altiarchaeota archaeon]